jgi:hypothetical protein
MVAHGSCPSRLLPIRGAVYDLEKGDGTYLAVQAFLDIAIITGELLSESKQLGDFVIQ